MIGAKRSFKETPLINISTRRAQHILAKHLPEFIQLEFHLVLLKGDQLTALETKLVRGLSLLEKWCVPNVNQQPKAKRKVWKFTGFRLSRRP